MTHFRPHAVPGLARKLGIGATLLALTGLVALWTDLADGPQLLALETGGSSVDFDNDGLVELQEHLLGTSDLDPDTDGDQADDIVELARGSDPLDANSVPGNEAVHVGMTARAEDQFITLVTAIYANYGEFPGFGFEMGVSVAGVTVTLPASVILQNSQVSLMPGLTPTGWIILVETHLSESLLGSYGYLGFFARVTSSTEEGLVIADVLNLFDFFGDSVQMVPSPSSLQGGSGSVYQPLGRGEDLPTSWEPNKICWQLTSQVGVEGSSVVLGVEDASCEDLDSYCHETSCQAAIGGTVKVLDAGALAGGQ